MRSIRLLGVMLATLALMLAVVPAVPTQAVSRPTFDFPWANAQTNSWTSGPHGLFMSSGHYYTCVPPAACASKVPVSVRSGLDFGGVWQVRPVAAGVVIYKGLLPAPLGSHLLANGSLSSGFGYGVVVDHGAYQTLYAHLDPASVAPKAFPHVGSRVTRSTTIGVTGCSGVNPCTKHLHLELRTGMNVHATGAAFYGKPASWNGWTVGGWTIKALALNYDGSATRCGTTVEAQANGSVTFTAGTSATCSTKPVPPASLVNGDFESPVVTPPWQTMDGTFGGWQVVGAGVDLVRTEFIAAAHGQQSVDLNSTAAGGVEQTFALPAGAHQLAFELSGNPDTYCGAQGVKRLLVLIDGVQAGSFTFDTNGHTLQDPGWVSRVVTFTSTLPNTTIEFLSDTPSTCAGPMIDFVRVQ